MPSETIFTVTGEAFLLTRGRLRSDFAERSYFAVDRPNIIKAFEQINSLLVPNDKNKVIIEHLGPNTSITVRKVTGYSQEGGNRYLRRWSFRLRGNGDVAIGCKVFAGRSSRAIRRWAKSAS